MNAVDAREALAAGVKVIDVSNQGGRALDSTRGVADILPEIVNIVNGSWVPTPAEQERMEQIRTEVGTRFCQWCSYCMPACPQEIYIPGLINSQVTWGLWNHEQWFENQASVTESGKTCIECGACEEKCPYQLPIREMIVENLAF